MIYLRHTTISESALQDLEKPWWSNNATSNIKILQIQNKNYNMIMHAILQSRLESSQYKLI